MNITVELQLHVEEMADLLTDNYDEKLLDKLVKETKVACMNKIDLTKEQLIDIIQASTINIPQLEV